MKTPDINQILRAAPRSCRSGAPLGACNLFDEDGGPLYVQRIRFIDGDYAADGTYWGGYPSAPLWCGFSDDGLSRVYVRANNRDEAVAVIVSDHPTARFARGISHLY